VFVVAIGALLFVTESALNVWDRLLHGPRPLLYGYVLFMFALLRAAGWLTARLLVRRKPREALRDSAPLTRDSIEQRLRDADQAGVDVAEAQAELRELAARQQSGAIHLCFFGEISTGKSSLIKALVPDADVVISPVGGSTIDIRHYRWRNQDGTQILLTDVPGTGGLQHGLDDVAKQEAQRGQVVLFVCDGDLTREERKAVGWLLELGKPLILVMNKSDRYSREEQSVLLERLLEHLNELGDENTKGRVVAVSAGGQTEVIERRHDGAESRVSRMRPADIGVLVVAINRMLGQDPETLDARRDRAVFQLAADKLAEALARYRQQRSEQIIRSSTRKAVIGALAAVSPGTDIIIQGFIGTSMTRQLCRLYGAAPRDLDVEEFLSLSQSRAGRMLPLSLAVAGNALKAFPGIGTVAGGVVHAVAYGLIFDALGRSLVHTLAKYGELLPEEAAKEFEDGIGEHIEAGVRQVAKMALDQQKSQR
jgi:GTP-binding protein EngB required for normal cell division